MLAGAGEFCPPDPRVLACNIGPMDSICGTGSLAARTAEALSLLGQSDLAMAYVVSPWDIAQHKTPRTWREGGRGLVFCHRAAQMKHTRFHFCKHIVCQ